MAVLSISRYTEDVMFENRKTSRAFDHIGPMDPDSYTYNVPIGNNSPTNVRAKIYDTPGNTPLNRAKGGLVELAGRYNWKGDPLNDAW